MPDKGYRDPPADFLAITDQMTTRQLERSLEHLAVEGVKGDQLALDMFRWTQEVIKERSKTENQLVLGADGHTYTQRQYREKQQQDNFNAGMGALTGNIASSLTYWLSEDPHLAGLLGGLFGAVGATVKGYNENRQMSQPDPAPVTPPSAGEPPRDVAPEGESTSAPTREEPSTDTQSSVQAGRPAAAVAEPRDGDPNTGAMTGNLGPMTFAELKEMADAIFGLPEYVIAATQALTNQGVAPTAGTAALLQTFVQATPPGTGALGGDADEDPAGSSDQGETPEAEATVSSGPEEPAAGDQVSGDDGMSYLGQTQGEPAGDTGATGDHGMSYLEQSPGEGTAATGDDGMSYLEQTPEGSGQEASTEDYGGGDAAVVVDQ